ncbi:MAG: hypothetical protein WC716_05995 [Chitinophagaceae bacterium]|jgi:hypothetical protein
MIKHLHSKNTPSNQNRSKKSVRQMSDQQMIREVAQDLLQPREQAITALLAKAAAMKLV